MFPVVSSEVMRISNPTRSGGFAAFSLGCSQTGSSDLWLQQIFIGNYVQCNERRLVSSILRLPVAVSTFSGDKQQQKTMLKLFPASIVFTIVGVINGEG
ncbi:hypothetical protein AtNW77_Chr3g0210011 [Arabidopsis thaliana]|jgi:hypothetical protein|uniref:Uncharacterized protein n=3 Tax=Arabidopsis TaxID=3701 RepID=A0A384L645_ARATH|nr:uncharacterized protein AT3G54363 [Arabidopsis thaliana]AEE79221.1 hypothetical protein AT3G54363 [Arabidopsis thaliana]KAG7628473.1 hypothetical protein ISN45_At03g047130 [Arabidopsis thaliana x Arabidopsis arenosa]OAP04345.1 hypothetical protein AXX17_AT3G48790 [Arabidopsis thaliana]CAA0386339.1 unnamed protein product [Arabidopsis thaliana]|eukprot:NP_001118836.1 hypothetical protein AT3G54363 [Arabidopsis thaliana]